VTTIAGTPQTLGLFGDSGAAVDALLYAPQAVARCGNGDLFVADTGNNRVRRIAAGTATITTVLGDTATVQITDACTGVLVELHRETKP
jgi:hypothetical protein